MLTANVAIGEHGPIISLRVSISQPAADAMRGRNRAVPRPIDVPALIDTGADCTLIDPSVVLEGLSIQPRGVVPIQCLDKSSEPFDCHGFDVDLRFVSANSTSTPFTIQVAGFKLGDVPYRAVIGRDLLSYCTFHYVGPDSECHFNA